MLSTVGASLNQAHHILRSKEKNDCNCQVQQGLVIMT